MTDGTAPRTPREMFDRLLPMFLAKDLGGFADLFTDDGVHELPFAPPGVPARIEGREQIRAYLTAITDTPLEHREIRDLRVHVTTDPDVAIAEYDAHGEVTTTGERYVLRYVNVMRLRDGRIAAWRDYWSPLEPARLLGAGPDGAEASEPLRQLGGLGAPVRVSGRRPPR